MVPAGLAALAGRAARNNAIMDADGHAPPPGKASRRTLFPRPGTGVNPAPFSARAYSRGLRQKQDAKRPLRESAAPFRGLLRKRAAAAPDFWQNLCPLVGLKNSFTVLGRGASGGDASGGDASGRGASGRGASGCDTSGRGASGRDASGFGSLGRGPSARGFSESILSGRGTSGRPAYEDARVNLWLLVLEAKKIPHVLVPKERPAFRGTGERTPGFEAAIYVPPLHVKAAVADILAVEAERSAGPCMAPVRQGLPGVITFFVLLALWHVYRWYFFIPSSSGAASLLPPDPSGWAAAFGLDVYRFCAEHEYWRAVTALTLHANDSHLFGNAAFGIFLFFSLCRRTGLGLGLFVGVLGGVLGNAVNAFMRPAGFLSTGFSTAVFAALGALCCVTCADIVHFRKKSSLPGGGRATGFATTVLPYIRPALAPLAAGLALLGLLGGGGEITTDYGAHVWGFLGGVLCAFAALPLLWRADRLEEGAYALGQVVLFTLSVGLLVAGWCHALLWSAG